MPRGGARIGAGRKAGTANKRTREIADREAGAGITPLEVMLATMRGLWARAQETKDPKRRAELERQAEEVAKDAAPFMHPRLSAVDHSGALKLKHEDARPAAVRQQVADAFAESAAAFAGAAAHQAGGDPVVRGKADRGSRKRP